jgi:hypothetical protein
MHPAKVDRAKLRTFTDLPNIGPAMAGDFVALGYETPAQLKGVDPYVLYRRLCAHSGVRQDPCVLDTFISVSRFLEGEEPQPWWAYTAERKQRYPVLP